MTLWGEITTKWGVVGSNTLLTPTIAEATHRFLDLVRANTGLVFVDLNVRAHLWLDQKDDLRTRVAGLIERADVVKASEADLAAIGGLSFLQQHATAAACVLTHGDRGAELMGDGRITVPAMRVHAVDATGAGDAFVAGMLAVLANSGARPGQKTWTDPNLWTRALDAGNLMGAKAVGNVGAVTGLTGLGAVREKMLTS